MRPTSRIVRNVDPYGYTSNYNTLKILANAILDKPELDNIEEGGRAFKERNDLLALILDQEQPYNSIEESLPPHNWK